MNYVQLLAEDRRLAILTLLVEVNGSANESVLYSALDQLGHRQMTRDDVRADLRFLETTGAVRLDWFQDKVAVATLLMRGADIAAGKVRVEGIKRPSIGA